jgi:hypothetical protein
MRATREISSPGHAVPQPAEPALRWRRAFKGDGAQVREVRRWLAGLLPECPARDDVVMVASELCANAIEHTASGRGGMFGVEIAWRGATIRVTVADAGAPTGPYRIDDPTAERGRGLMVVHGLCSRTGVTGGPQGRLVWGDLLWSGPAAPAVAAGGGHEAAIRDGLASLADRHRGVPAWFGRSTLEWWAVAGRPGAARLVNAPTPGKLGDLIESLQAPPPNDLPRDADSVTARVSSRVRPALRTVPPRRLLAGPPKIQPC